MHPPKIQTFDVPAGVNVDNKGFRRTVSEYRVAPFGLYMSRAIVGRPSSRWLESWLLPELGLCASKWVWNDGHAREQDVYLDIAVIERQGGLWRMTDLYLDVIVLTGCWTRVLDVDEFVEAVALGLLDPEQAEYAIRRLNDTVAALARHGNDFDAWLATRGITLSWAAEPGRAPAGERDR